MTAEQRMALIADIRTDFQIPPYQSDDTIGRAIDKCYARLKFLLPQLFHRYSVCQSYFLC